MQFWDVQKLHRILLEKEGNEQVSEKALGNFLTIYIHIYIYDISTAFHAAQNPYNQIAIEGEKCITKCRHGYKTECDPLI